MTTTCNCVLPDSLPESSAKELAGVFAALGDPTRLRLAHFIYRNHPAPVCACSFSEVFAVSRPTLSHHLNKLIAAGIIEREKSGKWSYYTVNPAFDCAIFELIDAEVTPAAAKPSGVDKTAQPTVLFICAQNPQSAVAAARFAGEVAPTQIDARGSQLDICDPTEIKDADYVVTLGKPLACPVLPQTHYENWDVELPLVTEEGSELHHHIEALANRTRCPH